MWKNERLEGGRQEKCRKNWNEAKWGKEGCWGWEKTKKEVSSFFWTPEWKDADPGEQRAKKLRVSRERPQGNGGITTCEWYGVLG